MVGCYYTSMNVTTFLLLRALRRSWTLSINTVAEFFRWEVLYTTIPQIVFGERFVAKARG